MARIFYFSIFSLLTVISSCHSNSDNKTVESPVSTDSINQLEELCFDPGFIEEQNQRDSLLSILNTSIDLAQMKKEIGFLSMGWSIKSSYLPEPTDGFKQYNYGAVGNLIKKPRIKIIPEAKELRENSYKFISIITYKPWTTAEEKYYSTDNETIIGFETRVNYEYLNELNFVGLEEDKIDERFGLADKMENDCYAYKEDQKVIVFHFENDLVDWVKYYRLNKETFLSLDYPAGLFEWTVK